MRNAGQWMIVLAIGWSASACGGPEKAIEDGLRENVIFFSNFEKGVDALWSEGNPSADFDGAKTRHHVTGGIAGTEKTSDGYIEFQDGSDALSYTVDSNFPYSSSSWEGAVAFWIGVDAAALKEDYPEPFHAGKKGGAYPWDDGVIFVDFTKAPERTLRFGCYPDKQQDITDEMVSQHVISAPGTSWQGDWHHVVITWKNFNSGKADAEWALYFDGQLVGRKSGHQMDMTWDGSGVPFRFNHYGFSGKLDEIAVFKKMLTDSDAAYLHNPKKPLNVLLKKGP